MKKYNRVMLGKGSMYAKICRKEGYIGAGFDIFVDLSDSLFENCRDFNNTIEKLNNLNPDFCSFITKLSKVMNASKDYTADARNSFEKICDKIFESDEEQENYCKEYNIPF